MKKNKVLFSALCISAALVVIVAGFCGCKSAAMPNKDVGAAQGGAGEKPVVATRISADENEEVYEVRFTDGKAFTFSVPRGKTGNDGAKATSAKRETRANPHTSSTYVFTTIKATKNNGSKISLRVN